MEMDVEMVMIGFGSVVQCEARGKRSLNPWGGGGGGSYETNL
jgi:hypothetical protein